MRAWPEKKRIEVATAHAMGLTAPIIEATTGVDRQTVRRWRLEDWFKDIIHEIQQEDDVQVDAKLTKLVGKSLDTLVDRLENGDFMYSREDQKFVRKPLSTRDAIKLSEVSFDKRNLLRGKPTSISAKQEQMSDRLLKLAAEFTKFVNAKDITNESRMPTEEPEEQTSDAPRQITEVEGVAHAIHDERA